MSDPSQPPVGELSGAQASRRVAPDAYFTPSPEYEDAWRKNERTLPKLQSKFGPIRWKQENSVIRTVRWAGPGAETLGGKPILALAESGPGTLRKRSAPGKDLVNAGYSALPLLWSTGSKQEARDRIASTFKVQGPGTEASLGRVWAFAPRFDDDRSTRVPPSGREVALAMHGSGLAVSSRTEAIEGLLNLDVKVKWPLYPGKEDPHIKYTQGASNGLPTMGNTSDPRDMERVLKNAVSMQKTFAAAHLLGGFTEVEKVYLKMARSKDLAQLVTKVGKTKTDCYAEAKIQENKLRFYAVHPRAVVLLSQQAYQPFKKCKKHILSPVADYSWPVEEREGLHSFSGASYAHGGAEKLVAALDAQLAEKDVAYVHNGDDMFWVMKIGDFVVPFDIDFRSYDITQEDEVVRPLKLAVREELKDFDQVSAGIWYANAVNHFITTHGYATYSTKDTGMSGGVGVSDVNDLLCDVFCQRLDTAMRQYTVQLGPHAAIAEDDIRGYIEKAAKKAAKTLGLIPKVGQVNPVRGASTLKEAIAKIPFLFCGYYLHVTTDGQVAPYIDIVRCLSQAAYPALGTVDNKNLLHGLESLRVACIVLSAGIPPLELRASHTAMQAEAIVGLRAAIDYFERTEEDPRDHAFFHQTPWGPNLGELSAIGLLEALLAGPETLWLQDKGPDPWPADDGEEPLSMFVPTSWADDAANKSAEAANFMGRPKEGALPRAQNLLADPGALRAAPPPTPQNHGRIPATKLKSAPRVPALPRAQQSAGAARRSLLVEEDPDVAREAEAEAQAEAEAERHEGEMNLAHLLGPASRTPDSSVHDSDGDDDSEVDIDPPDHVDQDEVERLQGRGFVVTHAGRKK